LALSNSLSYRVTLSFQWVPDHARLPGIELADSLSKIGVTLPFTEVPSPFVPVIAKLKHTHYSTWRRNISHNSLLFQISSISSEELVLSRLACCELPDFAATVTAFFCPLTVSMLDKIKEKLIFQRLRSSTAGANSPPSGLSCI